MRKIIYILFLSLFLSSCSKEDSSSTQVNSAPTTPTLIFPTDNLLCIDNTINFQWSASSDSNNDVINYQLEVSKNNSFTQITHTTTQNSTTKNVTLEKGVAYYWRVKSIDSNGGTSQFSNVFDFYTEGEGISNHLPFSPQLISPELNSNLNDSNTVLEWSANDVDIDDTLTYDVYFDTNNPPTTLVSENQNVTTFNIDLNEITEYYWKVVVKDSNNGQTVGQVWGFKTN